MDGLWTALMSNNLRRSDHSLKSIQNQLLLLPEKGAIVFVNQSHRLRDSTFAKRKTRFLWTMHHTKVRETINGLSSNPHGWVDDKIDNGSKLIVDFSLLYYSSTQALLATLKQWTLLLNSSRTFKSSFMHYFPFKLT